MGCDIHIHIEERQLQDDVLNEAFCLLGGEVWRHYKRGGDFENRSYRTFERLAGVRGSADRAIAPPRGFPADASAPTREDYQSWGPDAHTPSWLTFAELFEHDWGECEWWEEELKAICAASGREPEDLRMVFWFDC